MIYLTTRVNGKKTTKHRAIMEKAIGRKLKKDEIVHHINGNKLDNRLENLAIVSPQEHAKIHNQKYPKSQICVVCGKSFEPHPSNREHGKLCSIECKRKYLSNRPIVQTSLDGEIVKVWETIREASRTLGVSHSNIIACCNGRQKSSKGYLWRYLNDTD